MIASLRLTVLLFSRLKAFAQDTEYRIHHSKLVSNSPVLPLHWNLPEATSPKRPRYRDFSNSTAAPHSCAPNTSKNCTDTKEWMKGNTDTKNMKAENHYQKMVDLTTKGGRRWYVLDRIAWQGCQHAKLKDW